MRHLATALVLLTVAAAHSLKAADDYVPGPDSKPQEGVPKGVVTKYSWTDSKVFPGTVRDYWVYVPAQYSADKPACVFVCQDGVMYSAPTVFDNLIHKKEMPVTIGIFIQPGSFPAPGNPAPGAEDPAQKKTKGKAGGRSNRSVEYDSLGDKYSRFLLEEILPEVGKQYNLTKDPEGRCIAGNSSGAICAWTVAWERPDEFRKVFSSVGSFTNIRGGHVYPSLIRKTEKKPIRIFLQDGAGDLDNAFGNWPLAAQQMAAALKYQKYDYRFEFGDGGHTTKHSTMLFPDAMRWMWRDYKP